MGETEDKYNNMVEQPGYDDRYRNISYLTPTELENKPLSTTMDARSEDINIVVEQQKILYTIATVTAATFLISAIVLAYD